MKKLLLYIVLFAGAAGIGLTSCKDMLDLSPQDSITGGNFWKNQAQAEGFITAMHNMLRGTYTSTHLFTLGELRGGHFIIASGTIDGSSVGGAGVNQNIMRQTISEATPGVSNFCGYMGFVANCNEGIGRIGAANFLNEENRDYMLGMLYGMRAFAFYEMHRTFGKVVLRTETDVIDGVYDPKKLYLARSECSKVMQQIKDDLQASLDYFEKAFENDGNISVPFYSPSSYCYYWTYEATEALAADVYLWNAKVSTGDNAAKPEDIEQAKVYLEDLYQYYPLADTYEHVFSEKQNSEIILAMFGNETEYTHPYVGSFLYNSGANGATMQTAGKSSFFENGEPWSNVVGHSGGQCFYEYQNALFLQYDKKDSRRLATFLPCYHDADATELKGTFVVKNIGQISSLSGFRAFDGDLPFYRSAWVVLSLAEIANYEGDNDGVERYINEIRARAFGENWDEEVYGYKAGDFTQNEIAILRERTMEFVNEGQRWWDLRRMTLTKGGDPLVFYKEGAAGYGLPEELMQVPEVGYNWEDPDLAANADYTVEKTIKPVLDKSEEYKLLWPLDVTLMSSDPMLEDDQNPGY